MEEGKIHNDGSATLSKTVLSVAWSSIFRIKLFSELVQLHPLLPCAVSNIYVFCSCNQLLGNKLWSFFSFTLYINILQERFFSRQALESGNHAQNEASQVAAVSTGSRPKPRPDAALGREPTSFLSKDYRLELINEFIALAQNRAWIKPKTTAEETARWLQGVVSVMACLESGPVLREAELVWAVTPAAAAAR